MILNSPLYILSTVLQISSSGLWLAFYFICSFFLGTEEELYFFLFLFKCSQIYISYLNYLFWGGIFLFNVSYPKGHQVLCYAVLIYMFFKFGFHKNLKSYGFHFCVWCEVGISFYFSIQFNNFADVIYWIFLNGMSLFSVLLSVIYLFICAQIPSLQCNILRHYSELSLHRFNFYLEFYSTSVIYFMTYLFI